MKIKDFKKVNKVKQIELTENQYKVIKDKYLKNAPSVEAWLETVAKNIALAELMYHPDVSEEDVFNGTSYSKKEVDLYDNEHYENWGNYYSPTNPLTQKNKVGPLSI